MLQEFNQNQKDKVTALSAMKGNAELSWWRTWGHSGWAYAYF
ncbi:Trp operon leader peptide [Vibrio paucivorans]|uniref:Trp operon leader peptide n=1 Tax=Vibrio paucivorans TaxID=2829489 RepID=A0A9X3HRS6_9VIBR|nr:Trp operon leader peptide [Vibrio paucivorans]MCW8334360.1 Trp operon leader peptide [Vibrio paucivorans]